MDDADRVRNLESECGYTFKNKQLLQRALEPLHRPFMSMSISPGLPATAIHEPQLHANGMGWVAGAATATGTKFSSGPDFKLLAHEQLSFLGAGLLQLILSRYYWKGFPDAHADSLSAKRRVMMSSHKVGQIFQNLGLGSGAGVNDKEPLAFPPEGEPDPLAPAETDNPMAVRVVHALIGAVYQDAGAGTGHTRRKSHKAAKKTVYKLWGLNKTEESSSDDDDGDDEGGNDDNKDDGKGKDDDGSGSDGGSCCDCDFGCGDLLECCFCCCCDSD